VATDDVGDGLRFDFAFRSLGFAEFPGGKSLPTVAGELMSHLILRHALPNANHRTAIAMLQFCLETADPSFEMPSTHVDDEIWNAWVDPYIVESKRLITV
jgi:prophage maintenance system killer protein